MCRICATEYKLVGSSALAAFWLAVGCLLAGSWLCVASCTPAAADGAASDTFLSRVAMQCSHANVGRE